MSAEDSSLPSSTRRRPMCRADTYPEYLMLELKSHLATSTAHVQTRLILLELPSEVLDEVIRGCVRRWPQKPHLDTCSFEGKEYNL